MISEIVSAVSEAAKTTEAIKFREISKITEFNETGKKIIEPNIDIAKHKSLESISQINKEKGIERLSTINKHLEGKKDIDTGVIFKAKTVENSKGNLVEGVFPEFESFFDVLLPEELLEASDYKQFKECNNQLKEGIQKITELAERFTKEQLEQIMDGETPDGFTWHHDAEKGKMQLVDSLNHNRVGHTGGKAIWGGGKINR